MNPIHRPSPRAPGRRVGASGLSLSEGVAGLLGDPHVEMFQCRLQRTTISVQSISVDSHASFSGIDMTIPFLADGKQRRIPSLPLSASRRASTGLPGFRSGAQLVNRSYATIGSSPFPKSMRAGLSQCATAAFDLLRNPPLVYAKMDGQSLLGLSRTIPSARAPIPRPPLAKATQPVHTDMQGKPTQAASPRNLTWFRQSVTSPSDDERTVCHNPHPTAGWPCGIGIIGRGGRDLPGQWRPTQAGSVP
jgi:hypothetical protein